MAARPKTSFSTRKTDRGPTRTGPGTMAAQADRYALYQRAVQEPEADCEFFARVFKKRYGRAPLDLREDFCAAANTAVTWVAGQPERRAWGLDLDPEPIAWGLAHNAVKLTPEQRARLALVEGDVRGRGLVPPVDVVAAQNFSFNCFKSRADLQLYFEAALAGLKPEGLFILDCFGGPDAQRMGEEVTRYEQFAYVWDQARYDAITSECVYHIHFRFPDGSQLRKAFSYEWRLWTIRELREVLAEAGFASSEVYWEGATPEGEGNGIYTKRESATNEDAWLAYIVAVR